MVDDPKSLVEREQYYFDLYSPTFNCGKIVASPSLGRVATKEERLKLSKARKGKRLGIKFTAQHKANLSLAKRGIKASLGRILSEETKNKISNSLKAKNNKGAKQTQDEIIKRMGHRFRKVINTETNTVYNTVKEAAIAEGINQFTLNGWLIDTRRNKTKLEYLNG